MNAWLIRVEDTPEHRAWLKRMADDLLALQQPSGAIREEIAKHMQGYGFTDIAVDEFGAYEETTWELKLRNPRSSARSAGPR